MLLDAQQYNITVEYQPGKEMRIAHTLSRAHLPNADGGEVFDNVNVVSCLPVRKEKLGKIRRATKDEEVMCILTETILSG